ncbi:hypothetical protein X754_22985 [Mesorhizobium sp. LNJC403B00]|nr:hypothetical protein X754_22985 [Mesorhizobium sp. LNJC403B00]
MQVKEQYFGIDPLRFSDDEEGLYPRIPYIYLTNDVEIIRFRRHRVYPGIPIARIHDRSLHFVVLLGSVLLFWRRDWS